MKEEDYFKNLSDRERAIFEGGISMGALYHQFVGTPVNVDTCDSLEKAIEESILLQPAIVDVHVSLNKDLIKQASGTMNYTSLEGNMLYIEITTKVNEICIITCISYDEELNYPIMYIKD
ncbi:dihydroneopterin aldolase family protein [Methanosphaera sp.]